MLRQSGRLYEYQVYENTRVNFCARRRVICVGNWGLAVLFFVLNHHFIIPAVPWHTIAPIKHTTRCGPNSVMYPMHVTSSTRLCLLRAARVLHIDFFYAVVEQLNHQIHRNAPQSTHCAPVRTRFCQCNFHITTLSTAVSTIRTAPTYRCTTKA